MKNIDYSKSFLKFVDAEIIENGLKLRTDGREIVFIGSVISIDSTTLVKSEVSVENRATLKVKCVPAGDGKISEYRYFDGGWNNVDKVLIARTNLSGICVFLRSGEFSFFLSLDFPYSAINGDDERFTIGCDPMLKVEAGKEYVLHTLTVGASVLTGETVNGFDRAEIEAFSEYILSRMPEKFNGNRPIFTATSITNRMTDVRDGRIYYSMYDNPTLTLNPETLKEEIKICADLGIEYYQLFEGYFDWEEDGSSERNLKEIVELGKSLGVRVGDYMTALELNCWHYNYHDRHVEDKSLCALGEDGSRYYLCYGNDKVVEMLSETIIPSIIRNGEEMICIDGNAAVPCQDVSHGHNAGSYYALIKGLVEFMKRLSRISPYFMVWTNAGNWIEFMPKLLWYNPNVYLTDPHAREYSSSLNSLKYYGDCRREQMVTVHNKYFVPYTAFSNCEYYAFRNCRVNDMEFFEYSFLQSIAVTPNICFGELRTFLERISVKDYPRVKNFIKKWLAFIRENINCLKYVYQIGDSPKTGSNEAYARINKDRGYIFFVNQDSFEKNFTFELSEKIGLERNEKGRFLLSEIYPGSYPLYEQNLYGALWKDKFMIKTPGYSVKIIKIELYKETENGIRLFGVGGEVEIKGNSVFVKINEETGKNIPVALSVKDRKIGKIEAKTAKNVPKYYFPSSVSEINEKDCFARFTLNVARDKFNREISCWKVDGSEKYYCVTSENSDFYGGYIHNLYRENTTLFLSAELEEEIKLRDNEVSHYKFNPETKPVAPSTRRANRYETILDIPFIEYRNLSQEIGRDEVLELCFKDSMNVGNLKAFIDDKEVEVREYVYPFNNSMKTFYIELLGIIRSGIKARLTLQVKWAETCEREADYGKVAGEGAQVVQ